MLDGIGSNVHKLVQRSLCWQALEAHEMVSDDLIYTQTLSTNAALPRSETLCSPSAIQHPASNNTLVTAWWVSRCKHESIPGQPQTVMADATLEGTPSMSPQTPCLSPCLLLE